MLKKIIRVFFNRLSAVIYVLLFLFFAFNACRKNPFITDEAAVQFTATIVAHVDDRASGTTWEEADKIGVFMFESGKKLQSNTIVNQVYNQVFTFYGDRFKSKANTYLPAQAVDFIAYYPHGTITDDQYAVDVTDQSNPAALDLMYANNAKAVVMGETNIPLSFERQLSQVYIKLMFTNGEKSQYDELEVMMPNVYTQGGFDLAKGKLTVNSTSKKAIKGNVTDNNDGTVTIGFTLLPGEKLSDKKIQFLTQHGDRFTWKLPKVPVLGKGKRYFYEAHIDNGSAGDGIVLSQPFLEIPKMESLNKGEVFIQHFLPDDQKRRNYAMLYDKTKKMAYWVAYPMHKSYLGNAKRTDSWQYDPEISSAFQPSLFKGFGSSAGYDRGHQLPSADRNFSTAQNKTTFYFSNITAQVSRLNQGIWANLETKVRTWTAQCDTMYVVTGAMPTTSTNPAIDYILDNNKADIAKPKYYFKALAMKKGSNYYTIAYKMDNEVPSSTKFEAYQMTVNELEQITGFTFFPDLKATQKESIDAKIWK